MDDSGTTKDGTHYTYDAQHIQLLFKSASHLVKNIETFGIHEGSRRHARHNRLQRPKAKDLWLLTALQQLALQDKTILIVGSSDPWYEVLCLAFRARSIDVVDYNRVTYEHEQLRTFTAQEFWTSTTHEHTYDVVLCISSLDHSGLGRYGDPIAPDGDLIFMKQLATASFFSHATKVVVTVPLGEDLLAFNLMRIYGKKRLALLFQDYSIVHKYGYSKERVDQKYGGNRNFRQTYEPVFVLERSKSVPLLSEL